MSNYDLINGEILTVSVTVDEEVITAEINTAARGPVGPAGSGGGAWNELTGTADAIPFTVTTAPAHSEGKVYYDSTDHSLTYYVDEAEVAMNIGREMWIRVRNDTGSTIANGKVVYLSGATGQTPTIALARADSLTTSRVIGIATHDIENNSFGYVTTIGEVKGLNTSAFTDGAILFLSAVTAGEMTTTAPSAPNRIVQVATVSHAHVTLGKLYAHPETDSIDSIGIADSTSIGRALVTAATASVGRTTLGSTTTGDALFTAASVAGANQILGMVSGTAKGTTAAAGATTNVISLSIPSAGLWRFEALSTWINATSSSTLMSFLFDSNAVIPATNFRIGQSMVNATTTALTMVTPGLTASIGATLATASSYINSTAFGLIETTGASTLILRVQNTAGTGTSTVTQASLSATKL